MYGDAHVACITRSGLVAPTLPASGESRAGSVIPDVWPSHLRHVACSSQNPLTLFLALACHVARPLMFQQADDSKTTYYALMGTGLGAVAGLLVDTVRNFAADQPPVCQTDPSKQQCTTTQARLSPPFGTSILIGAGAGMLVGAIVGHQMSPSSRVNVSSTAGNGTVTLMAQAKF